MRGPFERLSCFERYEGRMEEWKVHGLLETKDPWKPHMTCLVLHNKEPDEERLMRSELYCAVSLMAGRMCDRQYCFKHDVAPVGYTASHAFHPFHVLIQCSL